jgi:hypothetical protein
VSRLTNKEADLKYKIEILPIVNWFMNTIKAGTLNSVFVLYTWHVDDTYWTFSLVFNEGFALRTLSVTCEIP